MGASNLIALSLQAVSAGLAQQIGVPATAISVRMMLPIGTSLSPGAAAVAQGSAPLLELSADLPLMWALLRDC